MDTRSRSVRLNNKKKAGVTESPSPPAAASTTTSTHTSPNATNFVATAATPSVDNTVDVEMDTDNTHANATTTTTATTNTTNTNKRNRRGVKLSEQQQPSESDGDTGAIGSQQSEEDNNVSGDSTIEPDTASATTTGDQQLDEQLSPRQAAADAKRGGRAGRRGRQKPPPPPQQKKKDNNTETTEQVEQTKEDNTEQNAEASESMETVEQIGAEERKEQEQDQVPHDLESPQLKRQPKKPRKYMDEDGDIGEPRHPKMASRKKAAQEAQAQQAAQQQQQQEEEGDQTPATTSTTTTTTTTTTSTAPATTAAAESTTTTTEQPIIGGNEDEEMTEQSEDKENKLFKKSLSYSLEVRPCWYAGCTKADRSLKLLRPLLFPTCKTHAIRSESKLYEALGKGFFIEEKGNKDTVCGICGEAKSLNHCANEDCAFGFCDSCTELLVQKYGNKPGQPKWVCWVCLSSKNRGKLRERTRWVQEMIAQPMESLPPRKTRGPKASHSAMAPTQTVSQMLQQQQLQLQGTQAPMVEDPAMYGPGKRKKKQTGGDSEQMVLRSGRKRGQAGDSATSGGDSDSQDAFQYHSILSPERDPETSVDFFIDQSFSSIKFFNSLITNPSAETAEQFNGLVATISRLRTIRWSNDYSMVWREIEELGLMFKRNLASAQTLLQMQQELKRMDDNAIVAPSNDDTRNVPIQRAIEQVFEHHQMSTMIEKLCTAARNVLVIAIDTAHKTIEEIHHNFEVDVERDKHNEVIVSHELNAMDDKLKKTAGELQQLKQQEDQLVEEISKVRSALSNFDAVRDSITKRSNDLRIEALLSKNTVAERTMDINSRQSSIESEIGAFNAMISLIEGVYWGHEYFYSTEIGECEKRISDKLLEVNQRIDLHNNDIPLAFALDAPASLLHGGEIENNNNNNNTVSTTTTTTTTTLDKPPQPATASYKTLFIYHTSCMEHIVPGFHLEKPDRIRVAIDTITDFKNRYPEVVEIYSTPPEVDMRYVMAVHDAHYIKKLETQLPSENSTYETHLESDQTGAMIAVSQKQDDEGEIYDTFLSHRSMKAALRASGAVCAAVDAVTKLGYHHTFCAIRPPGHHAGRFGRTSDAPSQGYCLINNVAIGAKYASLTSGYSRIAVVDFDVHHGNGTQEILSGDDNFLFISIHVCDEKRYFYPGTGRDVGDLRDDGTYDGNVLNVGLKINSGSATFLQAFTKKIIPRLEAYRPQLIFISAGFDGHKDDPTNGLKLGEEDYYTVTNMIKAVAAKHSRGRVISVLEGGYGIEKGNSLQRCLNSHLRALVEDPSSSEPIYTQAGDLVVGSKMSKTSNGKELGKQGMDTPDSGALSPRDDIALDLDTFVAQQKEQDQDQDDQDIDSATPTAAAEPTTTISTSSTSSSSNNDQQPGQDTNNNNDPLETTSKPSTTTTSTTTTVNIVNHKEDDEDATDATTKTAMQGTQDQTITKTTVNDEVTDNGM
ncbi:hypothetical protein SAMD00019534_025760 [Acytostelium subglobosum LB1]|uniref:hypothetical protein n=1 Tax=Acytostelium subglobosum LB1 TaxID=1410327 RepID=UPI00064487E9|nr:hypothetical protein SAMD00019534_025760 [Acytostelium subglobosum LB1]GAM19401.1 hypothetical protein SAMD00019534_025760 [Acytostelium subglobosum LB1]|eukprot:XP_012757328.1 hypothetical protein SAMD00019534_025760 [Acytostelium subglobosum LB1]